MGICDECPPKRWVEDVREAMNKWQLEEDLWEDRDLWHIGCDTLL